MFGFGAQEIFLLTLLGILLYGKRLPEVSRSFGKTIMEFKNSLRGVEDQFRSEWDGISRPDTPPTPPLPRPPKKLEPTAPKFQDPAV